MIAIFSSNDVAEISFARALLSAADIPFHVADVHTSMIEGSIGILPQRIMVLKADADNAHEVLLANGLKK